MTERKRVSDELRAARAEAETSRAWVRRQQEELTRRMRNASASPSPGRLTPPGAGRGGDGRRSSPFPGSATSLLRPPPSLGGDGLGVSPSPSPIAGGSRFSAERELEPARGGGTAPGEGTAPGDSPEAAAARAVAGAVADAARRAAAKFGSPTS